jgi:hypothetical protein
MTKNPNSSVWPILMGFLVTGCRQDQESNFQNSSLAKIANPESVSSKSLFETAEMLDVVHERLLRSKVRRRLLLDVEYSGLVARDSSKRGYLQGSPGIWTLTAQERGQHTEWDRFFLNLDPSERGVSVVVGSSTLFFRLVDARGRDVTHYELKNFRGLSVSEESASESSNTLTSLLFAE